MSRDANFFCESVVTAWSSKMRNMRVILVLVLYSAMDFRVEGSAEVMKTMTLNYAKALDQCKKEENLPDSIDADFNNFWKLEYAVTNHDVGCAVRCLSRKLDLMVDDGTLHHGNAKEFAMTHGADETTAQTMVDILHLCEDAAPDKDDKCQMALDVVNCFKEGIHKLNWAPDLDVVVGILAEI